MSLPAEIDLLNVYRYSKKASKTRAELDVLVQYIKDGSAEIFHVKEGAAKKRCGWMYEKHFVHASITRNEAYLYTAALLACDIARDSELSLAINHAIFLEGKVYARNANFLEGVFPTQYAKKSKYLHAQKINDEGLKSVASALENPEALHVILADASTERGWIPKKLLTLHKKDERLPEKKFTEPELMLFYVQVLILTGYYSSSNVVDKDLGRLKHGWGEKFANDHKSGRDMEQKFRAFINSNNSKIKISQTRKKKNDDDEKEAIVRWAQPNHRAPVATRARRFSQKPHSSAIKQTPSPPDSATHLLAQTPIDQTSRTTRLWSSAAKIATSLVRVIKRPRNTATPKLDDEENDIDPLILLPLNPLRLTNESLTETGRDLTDHNDDFPHPFDSPIDATSSSEEKSEVVPRKVTMRTFPTLPNYNEENTDHDFLAESHQAIDDVRKLESSMSAAEKEAQEAKNVMQNVLHLAAVGSPRVRTIMKAVLTNSMTNNRVTEALRRSGYPEKRQRRVIENKRIQNVARRRRATKLGIEAKTVDEISLRQFNNPLQNHYARARSQQNWNILQTGKDLPPPGKTTKISCAKVDAVVKWVVDNCQFRPGKTRNVRFRRDGAYLQNLPVYLRYGSCEDLHESYSAFITDNLRVGRQTFRTILGAITVKGSYNQGLSYFYVNFIDMIKLLLEMFDRMQDVVRQHVAKVSTRAEIEKWIEKAKANTKRSREYLTHHYYGEIEKRTNNSWTCAAHALGHSSVDVDCVEVASNSRLFLALSNHVYIYHLCDLILDALPDENYEPCSGELLSMFDLATLSAKEMFHYTKHLMRGWWQDTAVNELKKMLSEFKTAKACIMDHKQKLLPRSKYEGMSAYFSKAGISILGAMVMWGGSKQTKDGSYISGIKVWFIDIIMNNITSQEARDLMPCIEAIRSELQQEYFLKMSPHTDCLCFVSDNALVAAAHSPFIWSMNKQAMSNTPMGSSFSDDDSVASESSSADNITELDSFRQSKRAAWRHRINHWDHNDAFIMQWLTFEAQRGKTQLDTHFAYMNKQLTKACLSGGIDYLDSKKVFEALSYKGGSKATTTILLNELDPAQAMFDVCDKAMDQKQQGTGSGKLRQGMKSVHDITWNRKGATHRKFTDLDTEKKEIKVSSLSEVPEYRSRVGEVIGRHVNREEPVFFPLQASSRSNQTGSAPQRKDPAMLSTRIYNALMRYSAGMEDDRTVPNSVEEERSTRRQALLEEAEVARQDILFILEERKDFIASWDDLFDHPIRLDCYWAKKKNKDSDFSLSSEVRDILKDMFERGQGYENKNIRHTAERALSELQSGQLRHRWDQRLTVEIGKIKSFFSSLYKLEKKDNDKRREAAVDNALEKRQARGMELLAQCKECEKLVLERLAKRVEGNNLEQATIDDFQPVAAALLRAFIKCRLLDDAGSRELDDKMPNKGSQKDNKEKKTCPRTQGPTLVTWAHSLRHMPIKAQIILEESSADELDTQDAMMEEDGQDVAFMEEMMGELIENEVVVVNGDGRLDDQEDGDDSDSSSDTSDDVSRDEGAYSEYED